MKTENGLTNNIPVMIYIHGFRSGANGSKREQLQKHFEGRYRVILSQWKDENLEYFCCRLDGVQSYRLTDETLNKYDRYDIMAALMD